MRGVTRNGQVLTRGALPATAAQYRNLVLALQTVGKHDPRTPGKIVLAGQFRAH